ncbi:MAG: DUF6308 family protein [Candidatus Binataceae bacterium]
MADELRTGQVVEIMNLPSGLVVDRVGQRLRTLFMPLERAWYDQYDATYVANDSILRPYEMSLSAWLNSGITGNELDRIWQRRQPIEEALGAIGGEVDLIELGECGAQECAASVQNVLRLICVEGVALSKATKILHKKRPRLIPIFDTYVSDHYIPNLGWRDRDYQVSHFPAVYVRFAQDLRAIFEEVRNVRGDLNQQGYNLSAVRILEYLIWHRLYYGEHWGL